MPVVVGYLSTPEGEAALKAAIREAELRDTSISIIVGARGLGAAMERDRMVHEVKEIMDGRDIAFTVTEDNGERDIAEVIYETAARADAQLIVIGLRRRSPVGKLILGSNAQRILLEAHCPVLAVKAERESSEN